MPADNATLIQKAHDMETEGSEWATLTADTKTFIDEKQAAFDQAIADMQAKIDALTPDQLSQAERTEIETAIDNAHAAFDDQQQFLRALITPPTQPLAGGKKKRK